MAADPSSVVNVCRNSLGSYIAVANSHLTHTTMHTYIFIVGYLTGFCIPKIIIKYYFPFLSGCFGCEVKSDYNDGCD